MPEGSSGFGLGAQHGRPGETARFVVTSPTGRVAFEADGNYPGRDLAVKVRSPQVGKVCHGFSSPPTR